jgi:uncharacterized protein (TIGR00730 family)
MTLGQAGLGRVAVFCGGSGAAKPAHKEAAAAVGQLLARRGIGLVYGGGRVGLMGVLADAALAEGGMVTGVMPQHLVAREIAHTRVQDLRVVGSMLERKALMAELSDAFLALPGGFGTLDELFEMLTWSQIGLQAKPSALLNVDGFWDPLLAWVARAVEDGLLRPAHAQLLLAGEDAGELLDRLAAWRPPEMPALV